MAATLAKPSILVEAPVAAYSFLRAGLSVS
jgi:hypothetical protein